MNKKLLLLGTAVIATGLAIAGCGGGGGGDTGTSGDVPGSGVFNSNDVGSVSVSVESSLLNVSDTTGFTGRILDANGNGVPFTKLACDSEAGIAIIEPTTGAEITDAGGSISGRVGCNTTGSFLFGCRAPVATGKRQFITVRCSGVTPVGFEGFPGAAGGGLGTGGTGDSGSGGNDGNSENGIRITSIGFIDDGNLTDDSATITASIDVIQDDCNVGSSSSSSPEPEPFYDSGLQVKIKNETNSTYRFTGYQYSVPNASGSSTFTSGEFAFLGADQGVVTLESGEDTSLVGLFAYATNGVKQFVNGSTGNLTISQTLGFRTVTVTVFGENDKGDQIQISGNTTVSFGNYNNCD